MRLPFLSLRHRAVAAAASGLTHGDLDHAYRFFLGRPPEAGVMAASDPVGGSSKALIVRFLTSDEFLDNYVKPLLRGRPAIATYHVDVPGTLVDWVVRLTGVGLETASAMSQADTLAEALESLLRDPAMLEGVDHDELHRLGQNLRAKNAGPGSATRPELVALALTSFPESFLWHAYAKQGADRGGTKWQALRHLITHGASDGRPPPTRATGRAQFLGALGRSFAGRLDPYALSLLDLAAANAPLDIPQLEALGGVCERLGQPVRALAAFREAFARNHCSMSMLRGAVSSSLKIGDVEWAASELAMRRHDYEGEPGWTRLVSSVAEARLSSASDLAGTLYYEGEREQADALLIEVVDRIAQDFKALEGFGAPIPPDGQRRVLMLANGGLPQCKFYRIDQKQEILTSIGRVPTTFGLEDIETLIESLPGAEALIIYRFPAWPTIARAILSARALGVPVFYEIDDLIFNSEHYPDSLASYGSQISPMEYVGLQFGVPLFEAALALCDFGIASTEPLAVEMRKKVRSGQVWVVPNALSSRIERADRFHLRRSVETTTIFYGTGTRAHNSDFDELVAPALSILLARHPSLRIVIAGYLTLPASLAQFSDRILVVDFVSPVEEYWRLLRLADINIAVLKPSVMADCKSEIKWLEAAAFNIPSVVSATASYRAVLTDNEDVLFAETPDEWTAMLGCLIQDVEGRRRIGEAAGLRARSAFSSKAAAAALQAALDSVRAPVEPPPKPRLLIVNVFFPPQTLGGATRVVRDNVDAMIDSGFAEAIDIAILASDLGAAEGALRIDSYRGLPVFRLGTPEQEHMDWRPTNPRLGAKVAAIHGLWRPDLVHYHCVQRLTGSIVDVSRRSGVPYFITAHDAWWISDHQFLIDDEGGVVDPSSGARESIPPHGVSRAQSRERRRYLKGLLSGARSVLSVSESFSNVYRAAGVMDVVTVANGMPPLTLVPRRPSADGRLRLAHVGNITPHKGLPLVKEALSGAQLSRLLLTVVDHSRSDETARVEVWGATEVRIVGKRSQATMPEFYADQDVLLAPSIWPESFGLVTREAKAAGLWVVASDQGAIADDVTPGVDGFVVDVSSADPLRRVLSQMHADPSRYLRSPPNSAIRTSADQAVELMALYRGALGEATSGGVGRAI